MAYGRKRIRPIRGRKARMIRKKVRRAVRTAKRWPRKKLVRAYGQVSGKLIAVAIKKRRFRGRRRPRFRRYRRFR